MPKKYLKDPNYLMVLLTFFALVFTICYNERTYKAASEQMQENSNQFDTQIAKTEELHNKQMELVRLQAELFRDQNEILLRSNNIQNEAYTKNLQVANLQYRINKNEENYRIKLGFDQLKSFFLGYINEQRITGSKLDINNYTQTAAWFESVDQKMKVTESDNYFLMHHDDVYKKWTHIREINSLGILMARSILPFKNTGNNNTTATLEKLKFESYTQLDSLYNYINNKMKHKPLLTIK